MSPNISKFYKSCAVSNFDKHECDVAHIIPKKNSELHVKDANNCILLSKNLHTRFDKFHWTFDVFSLDLEDMKKPFVYLNIILCDAIRHENSLLTLFIDKKVRVNRMSLPFLYVHYRVFLEKNAGNPLGRNTTELFDFFMNKQYDFRLLQQDDYYYMYNAKTQPPPLTEYSIINERYTAQHNHEYLILWHGRRYGEMTWEPSTCVTLDKACAFMELRKSKIDPCVKV